MHFYLYTVVFSTSDYSEGIYMRVTFMSFTMAWNNPPSAPHSFSTVSMVAKKKKKNSKKRRGKRRIWQNIRRFKRLQASDMEI